MTPGNMDQMVKFHDLNNRKAFKLTDYSIYYQILPFPLFNNDGHDLRLERKGYMRFMEIFVTDNRLRIWRQKYLDHLHQEKDSNSVNLDDILPIAEKKRKTSLSGSDVSVSDRAHGVQEGGTERTYIWPEQSLMQSVAAEHTVVNKVSIITALQSFVPAPCLFLTYFIYLLYLLTYLFASTLTYALLLPLIPLLSVPYYYYCTIHLFIIIAF